MYVPLEHDIPTRQASFQCRGSLVQTQEVQFLQVSVAAVLLRFAQRGGGCWSTWSASCPGEACVLLQMGLK